MNVTVNFSKATNLGDWVSVIVGQGWKITEYDTQLVKAKKEIGQSEYPVRLSTSWYITITEDAPDGTAVEIEVPAFTDSLYARKRLLKAIEELADATEGKYETDQEFDVDVLSSLRQNT